MSTPISSYSNIPNAVSVDNRPILKGLAITAIVFGILIAWGLGGPGIVGLLESYHKISLVPILGNINRIALWGAASGGLVIGGLLIWHGCHKIDKLARISLQNAGMTDPA